MTETEMTADEAGVLLPQFLSASLQSDIDELHNDLAQNRASKRAKRRRVRDMFRPDSPTWLHHPVTKRLTPYGAKALARRRAVAYRARRARRVNR